MPSFDIVCEVDLQEIDNAVNQTVKEISARFDFRGGESKIEFDRQDKSLKILADDEFKLRSIHQILETKLAKRQIDCRTLAYEDPQPSSLKGLKQGLKQKVSLRAGLSKEEAKKIIQVIKQTQLKVQAQIQDEQVRVTGKKIDDLQEVMAVLRSSSEVNLPLQFNNMRT